MGHFRKYVYVYLLSGILLGTLFFFFMFRSSEGRPLPGFLIGDLDAMGHEISIYQVGDDHYVFLPSYASMERVSIRLEDGQRCIVGGTVMEDGMDCAGLEPGIPYPFEVDGKKGTIWFCRSANIATMYIDTISGRMDHIYGDKEHEEQATITLYTADGNVDHRGLEDSIKGRGNSTWYQSDKRPFALTLSSRVDLLGMGENEDWVLLANAFDESNLRQYLALILGKEAGLEWVPECEWVDLYLNGGYNGVYLLAEKVEVDEGRLELDLDAGDFLCKNDFLTRWDSLRVPFLTEAGRTVEISYPRSFAAGKVEEIKAQTDKMEAMILSRDISDTGHFDIDSWAKKYLVDEITANVDSDAASSYFYFKNGRCYAGPLWDLDLTLGNRIGNREPQAFVANQGRMYYSALYGGDQFFDRMVQLYRSDFRPALQRLIDGQIDELSGRIAEASEMNSLRWEAFFASTKTDDQETSSVVDELKDYLVRRVTFLDDAWLEGTSYHTVTFRDYDSFGGAWKVSVKEGEMLPSTYEDMVSEGWEDEATGEAFDLRQLIHTDMILVRRSADVSMEPAPVFKSIVVSVGVLVGMLVLFVTVDVGRRRSEKRGMHG